MIDQINQVQGQAMGMVADITGKVVQQVMDQTKQQAGAIVAMIEQSTQAQAQNTRRLSLGHLGQSVDISV